MLLIGADPGVTGAVAWMWPGLGLTSARVIDTPIRHEGMKRVLDCDTLARRLYEEAATAGQPPVRAYVERVHSMPKQGVVSVFTFGRVYGSLLGVLEPLAEEVKQVVPVVWQRYLGVYSKEDSRQIACTLYPHLAETELARKKDHNRADALNILYYGAVREGFRLGANVAGIGDKAA